MSFRELAEELRALLAQERRAIAALDHATITFVAAHKQHVAIALDAARRSETDPTNNGAANLIEIRAILSGLALEARANAMLAAAATEAVRTLLGRESTGYDKRARRLCTGVGRALATY